MTKRLFMLAFIAAVFLFGSACFAPGPRDDGESSSVEACRGLAGKARTDCEQQHGG